MAITRINNLGITDSTIVNADISASAAIASTKLTGVNDAKAFVNFNGTGTVAIRASFNVTSITDNGTGDYTINFTNAMTDVNYIGVMSGSPQNGRFYSNYNGTFNNDTTAITNTTTTYRIVCADGGGNKLDSTNAYVAFFR